MAAAWTDLDRYAKPPSDDKPAPPAPAQKQNEPTKPETPAAEKEAAGADKESSAIDQAPPDQPAPADQTTSPNQPGKPKKPADFLRDELGKVKTENQTLKAELEKLKSGSITESPEFKELQTKLEKEQQERTKLEQELKFTNYEKTQEYQERYQKPFTEAWASGRSKVSALKVTDPATGEQRPGTPGDFDAIMQAPSDESAAEMIEALFGTGSRAQIVTMARERVKDLNDAAVKAVEEFRTNGSAREKQFREAHQAVIGEVGKIWEQSIKTESIPEEFREFIIPDATDKEAQAIVEKGYKLYDQVSKEDARNPNLTPTQRREIVGRAAAMRHRAAAFGLMMHKLKAIRAENAVLQQKLKTYEDSEPPTGGEDAGQPSGADRPARGSTMDQALGALDKKARPVQFH